ncbi:Protocadherin Fat 1, partial [Stegodyphus mimosarum]
MSPLVFKVICLSIFTFMGVNTIERNAKSKSFDDRNISFPRENCTECFDYLKEINTTLNSAEENQKRDPCDPNPCKNAGKCITFGLGGLDGDYYCDCGHLYSGILCEKDSDPCSSCPCQNGG